MVPGLTLKGAPFLGAGQHFTDGFQPVLALLSRRCSVESRHLVNYSPLPNKSAEQGSNSSPESGK